MRRAALISGGIAVALVLAGSGMAVERAWATASGPPEPAATAAVSSVEDLGVPITTVRLTASTAGYWTDGRPVVYATGAQPEQPLRFVVLDAETGEQLDYHAISDTNGAHDVLLAPDGNVYIAAWGPRGYLLRYSPETREVTNLGRPLAGDSVITQIIAGDDGMLYGGGFPSGRVFSYDLETGEFGDLGVAVEGEQYARSLAYAPGLLYVGTEAQARLVSIDLETNERTEIDNPEWAADETRHYDLEYRDGLLFSYTSPSLDWHVYDAEADEWIDQIERNAQGGLTEVDEDGYVYFVKLTDGLYRYHIEEQVAEEVGWSQALTSALGAAGISLIELDEPEWPGQTVVGMGNRGEMWLWNPQTEQGEMRTTDSPEFPVTIRSLGLGPDGNVYAGGATAEVTVSGYDTSAEEMLAFTRGPSARVDAFAAMNDKLFFTTYGQGILFEYDPARDYTYGSNPRQVFQLYDEYHQERIYALETINEHTVALGTIGGRNVDTGQLFLYDDETQTKTDLGEPLQGHAVTSLTSIENYLIGGTTIDVLGGESPHSEARIFIWDLEAGEVVWDGVPEAGAKDISELVTDDDGQVWGLTSSGSVFEFDVQNREFVDLVQVGASGGMWGHGSLEFGPDERLYGSTAIGEVFALEPQTRAVESLANGEYALFDNDGRLYYAWEGSLFRMTFAESLEVEPAEVTFVDEPGTEDDTFTIPETEGVRYLIDGDVIEAGTYPGSGAVHVMAEAIDGYVLAEGATAQWSHTFDAAGPTDPGPTDPEPTDQGPADPDRDDPDPTDPGAGTVPGPGADTDPGTGANPSSGAMPATGAGISGIAVLGVLALLGGGLTLVLRRRGVAS